MGNNTQMTVREKKVEVFKSIINDGSIRNRIRTSMGKNAGSFIASMLDLYESENDLQNCDPNKVVMECLKAASLNLPIIKGLGFAYVVPYKSTPTFIVGYKGMIQLALRSGQYRILNADAIYKGEEIRFNRISGQIEIAGVPESNEAIGYFAYFQLINGFEKTFYMTVGEITEYAKKYSKAYNNGPWRTEFDAMAKKTVLRKILKYGPMSTEMQEAYRYEKEQAARIAGQNAQTEIDAHANKTVIDTTYTEAPDNSQAGQDFKVNPDTGEVKDPVPAVPPADELVAGGQVTIGEPDF